MNAKPLLIETIRIQNGRVRNIKYHNRRCNESRKALYATKDMIDLRQAIDISKAIEGEVKCRISYDTEIRKVEYEPYKIRKIKSLALIEIGDFEYIFKYADRQGLKDFFDKRGDKDDILMTKNGYLTDTYYANVALLQKGEWFTPKYPLLKGSRRAQLLEKGRIIESEIHVDQINEFEVISIFNAMIPFKSMIVDV